MIKYIILILFIFVISIFIAPLLRIDAQPKTVQEEKITEEKIEEKIDAIQPSSDLVDIIENVLWELDSTIPYSQTAKELLLLTVAVESDCGNGNLKKSRQIGIFQIEAVTLMETHQWAINRKMLGQKLNQLREISEVHYHAALARIYYERMATIPHVKWVPGGRGKIEEAYIPKLATIWKLKYNTPEGKGTVKEAVRKYKLYYWKRKY